MDNRVYLAACGEYERDSVRNAVHTSLAHFGGASALAGKGKRVLIKPNLLMPRKPAAVTTTHPLVIEAIAAEFSDAGAEVIIAESPGGPYNETILRILYNVCGIAEAAKNTGAKLNFDVSSKEVRFQGQKARRIFPIITPVTEADFIISAAKLKTHGMAYYSGAVKNMFGCIPGLTKAQYHSRYPEIDDFCAVLVDLCECVAPGLSVIDGVYGMEGAGPSAGTPKKAGVIITSLNPHAADLCAAALANLDKKLIPTLRLAIQELLIPKTADELDIAGESLEALSSAFTPPHVHWGKANKTTLLSLFAMKFLRSWPVIERDKCVGCGDCAGICPEKTIKIVNKKAQINYKNCIKCYCCHEMCPVRAISFSRRKGRNYDRN